MQRMFNLALAGFLAALAMLAMPAEAVAGEISVELNSAQADPEDAAACLLTFDLDNTTSVDVKDFRLTVAFRGENNETIGALKDLVFGQLSGSQARTVQFPLRKTSCDAFKAIVVSDAVCGMSEGGKQPCLQEPVYSSNATAPKCGPKS